MLMNTLQIKLLLGHGAVVYVSWRMGKTSRLVFSFVSEHASAAAKARKGVLRRGYRIGHVHATG